MMTLVDNDLVRITAARGNSDRITLCFTGVGHGYGGIDVQSEEFRKSAQQGSSIFVIDKMRSWGNNLDFAEIAEIARSFGRDRVVNAIGNSMGGFLAILATKFIDINACVAFAPQFSVHKGVLPCEHRWDGYVDKIAHWKYRDLGDAFNPPCRYYVFGGVGGEDDPHLRLIPDGANIHKIYFANEKYRHEIAAALRGEKLLYGLISDSFAGRGAEEIVASRLSDPRHGAFVAKGRVALTTRDGVRSVA